MKKREVEEKKEPEKKSFLKWIIVGAVIVFIVAGGGAGWHLFLKKDTESVADKAPGAEAKQVSDADETRIICPLESFIVNLADKSGLGKRYLKTTIELEVDDEKGQLRLQAYKSQLRDTILLLLTSQSFNDISSIEGKLDLKQALLTRINQTLGSGMVRRLYFTEFVVQ